MSQKNDCPTPDNATNEDTVGSKLARRITGLQSILEEHWLAAERADAEYRAEIKILRSDKSRRHNLEAGLMAGVVRLQDEVRRLEGVIAARDTPATHATPREGSVQGGCTLTDGDCPDGSLPVAWAVAIGNEGLVLDGIFLRKRDADEASAWRNAHTEYGARLIPLCAQSPPTLTDVERAAIKVVESDYSDNDMDAECWQIAATLRGLLKRTK